MYYYSNLFIYLFISEHKGMNAEYIKTFALLEKELIKLVGLLFSSLRIDIIFTFAHKDIHKYTCTKIYTHITLAIYTRILYIIKLYILYTA